MNLNHFLTQNLFAASQQFFGELGIALNSNSKASLELENILGEHYKDQAPFTQVTESYFLGLVDDEVLASKDEENTTETDNSLSLKKHKLKPYAIA